MAVTNSSTVKTKILVNFRKLYPINLITIFKTTKFFPQMST